LTAAVIWYQYTAYFVRSIGLDYRSRTNNQNVTISSKRRRRKCPMYVSVEIRKRAFV